MKFLKTIVFFLLAGFFGIYPKGVEVLDLGQTSSTRIDLSPYLYFYEDSSSQLNFFDILKKEKEFYKNTSRYPAFGFTHSAIWGKFVWKGRNLQPHWKLLFNYSMLDRIDIYITGQNGELKRHIAGGADISYDKKPVPNRKQVFAFKTPGDEVQTIYFRVYSEDTVEIPLYLMSDDSFNKSDSSNSFVIGIYYGIILVMLIYNFFIFLTIKDSAYLNYVIYLINYGVVQLSMDGLLNEYIFSHSNYLAKTFRMVCANIAIIFALRFANNFFRFRINFPKFNHVLNFIYFFAIINSFYVFFNFTAAAIFLFILLFAAVIIFIYFSIKLYREYPPVRLYFFGWITYIVCTFLWVLKLWNIYIPEVTPYAMQFGSATEVTLLSFALGGRINMIRLEKEKLKRAAKNQMRRAQKEKSKLEILKNRSKDIEKDLSMARDIQMSMIPLQSPVNYIKSLYLPMEKVGGDFFNIIPLKNNKLGIFISDVSGHGIPAALITVMLRSMIVTGLNELNDKGKSPWLEDPDDFLYHLNNSLYGHLHGNFISAFYGIYDSVTHDFTYRSASHPPPIILDYGSEENNKIELSFLNLSPQLPPLGIKFIKDEEKVRGSKKIIINDNKRLFLYSDGLMDNIDYNYENMEKGMESFKSTILYDIFSDPSLSDITEFMQLISSELLLFRLNSSLEDDVCIVTMDINKG